MPKAKAAPRTADSAATPMVPTTQRAYTLRLRCAYPNDDGSWRDALWTTHEVVNKGAKAFGDWQLTLRGGLSHELAEPPAPPKDKTRSDDETAVLRKNRRILLALSWLSVEDERGAPKDDAFRVATGRDADSIRREKLLAALQSILERRKAKKRDIESWLDDCANSLAAKVREDAVWVNRAATFAAKARELRGPDQEYAYNTIMSFFGPEEDYFTLPDTGSDEDVAPGGGGDEGPEFRTLARQWASTNFGTGDKSDTKRIVAALRTLAKADFRNFARHSRDDLISAMSKKVNGPTPDLDGLRVGIGWSTGRASKGRLAIQKLPGRLTVTAIEAMQAKLTEEADDKEAKSATRDVPKWMPTMRQSIEQACGMPFRGARDHIGEFSVMLDHAARRVSIAHSWIKRAEAQRRKFEEDARRLDLVPSAAAAWLDDFVRDRSVVSGALSAGGEYRIRRRAIEAWEDVFKRWSKAGCTTADDRIAAAREVQAEIEKFGDIQLFEALAADDAECVWHSNGKVDPSPLRDYVLGHNARFRQRWFKVPAYRHPDPLRHPVFCDFGNSRWDIRFAVHEREKARRSGKRISADETWLQYERAVRMGLWTGQGVERVAMSWACKRLVSDLGLSALEASDVTEVSRADRLGRAAAGATGNATVLNVFDEKDWNGRLQAPRAELDRIARLEDKGESRQAQALRQRLRWLVSFSPRLRPSGPFIDYIARLEDDAPARPFVSRKGEYAIRHESSDKRKGHARLVLSRLPGLRVLSVDLGHRFAAAGAVWETISAAALKKEVADRAIAAGGIGKNDLYCHTLHTDRRGNQRKTVYRRIGPDRLPDGATHPAPWARLDRQFLIKLQGEERPARAASQAESDFVRRLESDLGRTRDENGPLPRQVDELMAEAMRSLRLGLARHARRAKIAWALDSATRTIMGTGGSETPFTSGDDAHITLLTNALFDWHALATERRWDDLDSRDGWNRHIAPLKDAWKIDPPESDPRESDERTRQQRRKDDEALRDQLKPIAQALANSDRGAMHAAWRDRWLRDDGSSADRNAGTPAKGWYARLRRVSDWVTGRRHPADESPSHGWKQNVGGLSLTRIATMRSLYQLHKAFAMRARPNKPRGAPEKGESNAGVAQSLLDAMERMREQRVKQLASRIVEAALGVGRMKPGKGRDRKRPRSRVDEPCHAVVIESLRHYRPDELRTRRENKALMTWSSGKVGKYLQEACQLHGLLLRDVPANYTSRQCSRTGLPGLRCDDVPLDEFLTAPWWNRIIKAARKKVQNGSTEAEARFLVELHDKWTATAEGDRRGRTVRVPRNGGDLFVAAPPWRDLNRDGSQRAPGGALQADLNAAANIGLRALLDPESHGKWWYVPCDSATGSPAESKCGGSKYIATLHEPLLETAARADTKGGGKMGRRSGEIANAWRDVGGSADWQVHAAYWNGVRARVVAALRPVNRLPATDAHLEAASTGW